MPVFTKLITVPLTVMVSPGAKLVPSAFAPAPPDNVVVPLMGTGLAALLSTTLPATCSGGNVTDGGVLKPSAANAAAFVVVTFRLDPALLRNVTAPPLTVDGTVVPVMASIFPSKVPTVSVTSGGGRAGVHKVDHRAVDGDGVAGREAGGQRVRARGAR